MEYCDGYIIGSGKAGTSSLAEYLKMASNELFILSPKEPQYFVYQCSKFQDPNQFFPYEKKDFVTEKKSYEEILSKAPNSSVKIDASTSNFVWPEIFLKNLQNVDEDAKQRKIIIILRNRVDSAIAHYRMIASDCLRIHGTKLESIEIAFEKENQYLKKGEYGKCNFFRFFYAQRLQFIISNFEKIKIFTFEELKNEPDRVLTESLKFLGVKQTRIPNFKVINSGKVTIFPVTEIFYQNNSLTRTFKKIASGGLLERVKKIRDRLLLRTYDKREIVSREFENRLRLHYSSENSKLKQILVSAGYENVWDYLK